MIITVLAQATSEITNPALSETLRSFTGSEFLSKFIGNLVTLFLIVGAVATLFLLLWGGIQVMTAGADKAATEAARGRITAAVIGLLILFSTFAIMKLLETILGVSLLTIDLGPIILK